MEKVCSGRLTRRSVLRRLLGAGMAVPLASLSGGSAKLHEKRKSPEEPPVSSSLSAEDDQLLQELEELNFCYFMEQANPQTGLVKDRCQVKSNDYGVVGSIAATGFGLTALCIAHERGFVSSAQAQDRALATLHSLWSRLPNHRGFFLPLGEHQHRRKGLGRGDLFGRYRHPALRRSYLPGALPASRDHSAGV